MDTKSSSQRQHQLRETKSDLYELPGNFVSEISRAVLEGGARPLEGYIADLDLRETFSSLSDVFPAANYIYLLASGLMYKLVYLSQSY